MCMCAALHMRVCVCERVRERTSTMYTPGATVCSSGHLADALRLSGVKEGQAVTVMHLGLACFPQDLQEGRDGEGGLEKAASQGQLFVI